MRIDRRARGGEHERQGEPVTIAEPQGSKLGAALPAQIIATIVVTMNERGVAG